MSIKFLTVTSLFKNCPSCKSFGKVPLSVHFKDIYSFGLNASIFKVVFTLNW
nr:MAG TPA: Protein of unknown function (DUF1356) [Bacteriophage sp.]